MAHSRKAKISCSDQSLYDHVDQTHEFFRTAKNYWMPLSLHCYYNHLKKNVFCRHKFHKPEQEEEKCDPCKEETSIEDIDSLMVKKDFVIKERFDTQQMLRIHAMESHINFNF